jgi:tripartite-type tricarboxylate transporter receptor subunit TctC
MKRALLSAGVAVLAMCGVSGASAESYPSKPIRLVVPFPAGGPTDVYGRLIAQHLYEAWGQPVIAENRPGATGVLGTGIVVKSPADGYTLLMAVTSSHISPYLYKNQEYDPNSDLAPVINVLTTPYYLVGNPSFPANTIKDVVDLIKKKPGGYSYGSPGAGSGGNMAMEMFKQMAGLDIVQVPYKGAAPEIAAVVAGEVPICFDTVGNAQEHVAAGRLKEYGVTGKVRSKSRPNAPTFLESGYPEFEAYVWFGLFAPKGTPPDIVNKLNGEVTKFMETPVMQKRLSDLAGTFEPQTPAQYHEFLVKDTERWRKIIASTGMRAE